MNKLERALAAVLDSHLAVVHTPLRLPVKSPPRLIDVDA